MTPEQRDKLKFIWSRNKTTCKDQLCYLKDMSKVFDTYKNMNARNTFLLDDNQNHFHISPNNIQHIKPWRNPLDCKDTELVKILKFMN